MRKSKYLHGAGVLNDGFPLVPIDFARGTEEFGGPDSREQCLLGGRIFVVTSRRSENLFPLETSGIDNIIFGTGRRKGEERYGFCGRICILTVHSAL